MKRNFRNYKGMPIDSQHITSLFTCGTGGVNLKLLKKISFFTILEIAYQ